MIGSTLRAARIDAGLTQQKVAEALGISVWTYNRLEKGHRKFEDEWIPVLPIAMRMKVVNFLRQQYERRLAHLAGIPKYQFTRGSTVASAAA